jgi:hypothetical protein
MWRPPRDLYSGLPRTYVGRGHRSIRVAPVAATLLALWVGTAAARAGAARGGDLVLRQRLPRHVEVSGPIRWWCEWREPLTHVATDP